MEGVGIVSLGVAVFAAALLVGWRVVRGLRFRRPHRAMARPIPSGWQDLIEQRVPSTRAFTPDEWGRLVGLIHRFLREKHFEGGGGLEVTEEMRLVVAAQACLLQLNLDADCYPGITSILLYPATFLPRWPELDGHLYAGPIPRPVPLMGEHVRGAVVLSWDSVEAPPGVGGHSVVMHEFAHELDREDGFLDGVPLLEAPSSTRVWARVLQEHFDELRRAAEAGQADLLSAYGATNRGEFFAVATETFFAKPLELRERYPDLYRELAGFYRQDPAERASRAPPADLGDPAIG